MTNEMIEMLNAENISINNGGSYMSAAELDDEQVVDVFDQIDPRVLDDETMHFAEDVSSEIKDDLEAKRMYIAAVAEKEGEIVLG